jgi:hypothetical protein
MAATRNTLPAAPNVPNTGKWVAGAPVAWAKPIRGGVLGVVKAHYASTVAGVPACGRPNANTSTYTQAGYKPLHVLYCTTPQGMAAMANGNTAYANGQTANKVLCTSTKCMAMHQQASKVRTRKAATPTPEA